MPNAIPVIVNCSYGEARVISARGSGFIIGHIAYTLDCDVYEGEETAFARVTRFPQLKRSFDVAFLQEQGVI